MATQPKRDFPKDPLELGALWMKNTAKGEILTGTLVIPADVTGTTDLSIEVVCWPNRSQNPLAPVWRVKRSLPRPDYVGQGVRPAQAPQHEPVTAPDEEDIPF